MFLHKKLFAKARWQCWREEIDFFVKGFPKGDPGTGCSFAMATYFHGMEMDERVAFAAMRDSGEVTGMT